MAAGFCNLQGLVIGGRRVEPLWGKGKAKSGGAGVRCAVHGAWCMTFRVSPTGPLVNWMGKK